MTITFNIWVILFGSGLVIGIFLQCLFLFSPKRRSKHFKNISAALFVMILLLFDEFMQVSDLVDHFPFFLELTSVAELLIWPFLFFYVRALSGRREPYTSRDFLFFSPFIVGTIWQWPYLVASGPDKFSYFEMGLSTSFILFIGFKSVISLGFLAWILSILSHQSDRRESGIVTRKSRLLQTFRKAFWVVLICMIFIYGTFFLNQIGISFSLHSDKIGSLLIMCTFYLIGILTFNPTHLDQPTYSGNIISSLKEKETSHINQLLTYFESSKPYLKNGLNIKSVAHSLDLSTQQLSYLLNQEMGVSFQEFVNRYRVDQFKQAIKEGQHQHKTLLGIALESGFTSKATFNRAFKNSEGISPSDFIKRHEELVSNSN